MRLNKKEIRRRFKTLSEKHARIRDQWKEEARKNWDLKPMTVPRMVSEVWEVDQERGLGPFGEHEWREGMAEKALGLG